MSVKRYGLPFPDLSGQPDFLLGLALILGLFTAEAGASSSLKTEQKTFCETQLTFTFETPKELWLERSRFNDTQYISMRKDQLIRKSQAEGFVSLSGYENIKAILNLRPKMIFRFFPKSEKPELLFVEGHIQNVQRKESMGIRITLSQGNDTFSFYLNERDLFLAYHPTGTIFDLLEPL